MNELEGAVQATTAATESSSMVKDLLVYIGGPVLGIISLLFGLALKRKQAENATEDTVYHVSAQTIARLTLEVKDRDARITQLMADITTLSHQRNEADMYASRATVAAEIAEDSAKRASAAAQEARNEVTLMRAARMRDHSYIKLLRLTLMAAGAAFPPEPDGWEAL